MKKKITMVVSLLLVMALSIGGTLAYLTDKTTAVTNTFTVGKVDIELAEPAGEEIDYSYPIVPGDTYAKDPTITVAKDSEKSYVFVTIVEAANTITVDDEEQAIVEWAIAAGWTEIEADGAKVYYQIVEKPTTDAGTSLQVFAGDTEYTTGKVSINENLTMEVTAQPTITIQAAAIQFANIDDVTEAWDNLPDEFKGSITIG